MKLIVEDIYDSKFITEDKDGKKSLYIEGTFLQGGVKNRNNRFYPVNILEREVESYRKNYIEKNKAYGELGHPKGPTVNLDRVSHIIKELKQDGNNFVGRAKIVMGHPMGKIAAALIEEGANLGVSSRGIGSLKPDTKIGADIVQDDFRLAVGADIVADPSAPDAFVRGVMESCEWVWSDAHGWQQKAIEPIIEEVKKNWRDPDRMVELFEKYLNILAR